jgi:subtilase family serine protease
MFSNGTVSYYESYGQSTFEGARFYASNSTALTAKPRLALPSTVGSVANVTTPANDISASQLQAVYNATSLYSQGFEGQGQTIGLLDFFGSPSVGQDLKTFDHRFKIPDSNFSVKAIGPYDPNLGVYNTWNIEIALDAEVSHAMAPKADEIMYIANNALTFSDVIASVVQDDKVNTLSQSFSLYNGDWQASDIGPSAFYFNVFLADQQYMLGSLEGISFLVSSGDAGGSGYSSGPLGTLCYPDASPYVTSVGGSQSYIYTESNGTEEFEQTTWSNLAFVPNQTNYGGGGGGVSMLEPKPWYQQGEPTPASYPNGRLEPDLVLQAGVDPATYFVAMGQVGGVGGTSESSPLLAGLLTLVAQSSGGRLGLVTPTLYSLGNNPAESKKVFTPTPIGYIVPFVPSKGYNLASGWGAPNIGELAQYYKSVGLHPGLNISVSIAHGKTGMNDEFTSGQTAHVKAVITNENSTVTTGSFTASIETLGGSFGATAMSYNAALGAWTASITMGEQSGMAFLNVEGSSGGLSGAGSSEFFAGYLATFTSPYPTQPWTTVGGLVVTVTAADMNGNPAPYEDIAMNVSSYNILDNRYTTVDTVTLKPSGTSTPSATANLTKSYPTGPTDLTLQGDTYGFLPFHNGIFLQATEIFPQVAAQPGAVAPGQSLLVMAFPQAPENIANVISSETGYTLGADIATGSNVTAALVSPSGETVANASVVLQPCKQFVAGCNGGLVYNGELTVPPTATPGLYTILLEANYTAVTLQTDYGVYGINGSFYGQVMVTGQASIPYVTVSPSTLYEGEKAQITADIHYTNGTETKFGEYSAFVYPEEAEWLYTQVNAVDFTLGYLVQLAYSPTLDRWIGSFTAPSPYNNTTLAPVTGYTLDYSGPYEAFVTGHSYDGVPTDTDLKTQQTFFIQPYTLVANQTLSSMQQSSGLALSGDTIEMSATLSDDVFLGTNTIEGGTTAIRDSTIAGSLNVSGAQLSLVGVSGGTISAVDSQLRLTDSSVHSLSLKSSTVSLNSSSYESILPALPTIRILQPAGTSAYNGTLNVSFSVVGQGLSAVGFSIDGVVVQTFSPGSPAYTYALDTTKLSDGVHSLTVTATQKDGISSEATTSFSTDAKEAAQSGQLKQLDSEIGSLVSRLNSTINSLTSKLNQANSSVGMLFDLSYVLVTMAVAGIIIGVVALRRKRSEGG